MDDLEQLILAIRRTPVIDNHAHNLVDPVKAQSFPFHLITTEAHGEALESTFSSLSHLRALKQLKELYEYDGPEEDWTWDRLLEVRQRWMGSRRNDLYQKCFEGTYAILMDDGLSLGDDVHPYGWYDRFTQSPTKRIVRIEREAELIMSRLLSNMSQENVQSEEFHRNIYHNFAELFHRAIKERIDDNEVVGFKSVICYRSGLDVNPSYDDVDQHIQQAFTEYIYHVAANENNAQRFRFDYKPLNDYILLKTLQPLAKHPKPKPMQFHTGLGDNDINLLLSNPGHLQPLIEAYPTVPFVLLHSSYPYTREAGYLATVFANVFLDLGEVFPMLSTDGQVNVIEESMDLTPAEKLLWSTDGHLFPETYWLANKQFREALRHVLVGKVRRGQLGSSIARKFAEGIMFNNSNSLYGLGLSLPNHDGDPKDLLLNGWRSVSEYISRVLPVDCRYVFVQWVTYMGEIRARILPVKQFKRLMSPDGNKRLGISRGNTGTLQNDGATSVVNTTGQIYIEPQIPTLRPAGIFPAKNVNAFSTVMSRWTDARGEPIEACPIHALIRSIQALEADYGLHIKIGFELEVVFLKRHASSPNTYEPLTTTHSWGTFNPEDLTQALPLLHSIGDALERCGIEVQQMHSEAGPGQYEIVLAPLPAVDAIHTLYSARQIIQHVAELDWYPEKGEATIRASFHACPIPGTGNASHAHISLNDSYAGTSKAKSEKEMSELEMGFWAGVLEHLEAICAFSMPEAESYERVVEDHWTGGVWVAWGTQNREVPLRRIGDGSHRWEVRCLDGFANMYLAMAAILAAGLEGVKEGKGMRINDCDVNPARVAEDKRLAYGISRRLPKSIWEAIEKLEEDVEMREWLGSISNDFLVMKKAEMEMLGKMGEQERRAFLIERY